MIDEPMAAVRAELDAWERAGQVARLWFRDDDAMAPTPALDRLLGLSERFAMPILLAVIPMRAERSLAARLASQTLVEVAMHGLWHRNHAPAGEKAQETPAARGAEALSADFAEARARLQDLFGSEAGRWYVPPWNRIAPDVAGLLPSAGFSALSAFGQASHGVAGLAQINCQIDLIDWRGGRVGRSAAWVASELALALAAARLGGLTSIGVLGHHLDHDETTWSVLEQLGSLIAAHPAACWVAAGDLLP